MNLLIKKNMKLLLKSFALILFLTANSLRAQQNVLFNTYLYDPMQLNIAYVADQTSTEANLNYRTQWTGLKESPKLIQLNAHKPLVKNTGIGVRLASQQSGLLNNLLAMVGFGYQAKIDDYSKILFGIGIGFMQNTLNASKATVIDANDITLKNGEQQTAMGFDSEIGVQYIADRLKLGVALQHLYSTPSDFSGSSFKTLPQMNATISYMLNKDQKFEIEPMLVNRLTLQGANALEGFLNFHFNKMVTIGAGYRSNYGIMAFAGLKIKKLKIAYSFDYGMSSNKTLTGASHQILLGFIIPKPENGEFNKTKGKKIMKERF